MNADIESKKSAETPEEVFQAARALLHATTVSDGDFNSTHYNSHVDALATLYATGKLASLVPILPLLLKLKGQPYSLRNHFPMEPMFSLKMPRSFVFKCGRQVSKSTTLGAQGCIQAAVIPYFSSLYVAPRFEQTRRFSNNYVKPFLINTPLGDAILSKKDEQSVLQRSFRNGSTLHFSFAFLDPDRVRGISADQCRYDEVQDLDTDFIPIINETLSASEYDMRQYTGTPKTFDNTLQGLWERSSQAEWIIQCSCGYWNIATVEFDLLRMIQKNGLSCAKCDRLIDSSTGHWEHRFPEKRFTYAGYHVPQPVMPMHYLPNPKTGMMDKWADLWAAKNTLTKAELYNEKLGESCDVRVSLVTKTDLQSASVLRHANEYKAALKLRDQYTTCTMGVDWGGGGEKGISHTAIAILGHRPNGQIDVIYGERLVNITDPAEEVALILHYYRAFRCSLLAHDFCGAGAIRETLLIQAGFPIRQVFNAAYVRATAAAMVTFKPPTGSSARWQYTVDKARSLVLLCQLIKHGHYRFPRFETWESLADDFLALVEDKHSMARGADIYLVTCKANRSDDFAHAVNYASLCQWHVTRKYPDLASRIGIRITAAQEAELSPEDLGATETL